MSIVKGKIGNRGIGGVELKPIFEAFIDYMQSDSNGSFGIIGRSGGGNPSTVQTGLQIPNSILSSNLNNFIVIDRVELKRVLRTAGTGATRYRIDGSFRGNTGTGTTSQTELLTTQSLNNLDSCSEMVYDLGGLIPIIPATSTTRYVWVITLTPVGGTAGVAPACSNQGTYLKCRIRIY
jgi:hypothetical protein